MIGESSIKYKKNIVTQEKDVCDDINSIIIKEEQILESVWNKKTHSQYWHVVYFENKTCSIVLGDGLMDF